MEFHETEYPKYEYLKDSYIHSKVSCSFCSKEMIILYNKDCRTLKAINENWLLELKAFTSFSKLMRTISNDMKKEISRNGSVHLRFELMKLKEIRDRMQKRHIKIQKKYKKQKMEWRNNLLIDELRRINRQSDSKE